jgi:hypothetical protein
MLQSIIAPGTQDDVLGPVQLSDLRRENIVSGVIRPPGWFGRRPRA